jgi:hypothetical protein
LFYMGTQREKIMGLEGFFFVQWHLVRCYSTRQAWVEGKLEVGG